MLKVGGCFMAGLATHPSPSRTRSSSGLDSRIVSYLLEEAPETYYLTDYYQKHPVVLARLARLDPDALRDLLASSRS